MKRMVSVLIIGAVMFGLSAGVSLFMRRGDSHQAGEQAPGGEKKNVALPNPPGLTLPDGNAPRPAVRPSPAPSADSVVQLAANLRQQQEALRAREQGLLTRQKHLELIGQDLKTERKSLDDVRQKLNDEMRELLDKLGDLERKASDLNKHEKKVTDKAAEFKKTTLDFEGIEQTRIKQMAAMYDSMEADKAAATIQQMADGGKMDMAVKILSLMRERQASRVLAEISLSDPMVVVQLLDRMKGLRKAGSGGGS